MNDARMVVTVLSSEIAISAFIDAHRRRRRAESPARARGRCVSIARVCRARTRRTEARVGASAWLN